jgi:hypothetical protein
MPEKANKKNFQLASEMALDIISFQGKNTANLRLIANLIAIGKVRRRRKKRSPEGDQPLATYLQKETASRASSSWDRESGRAVINRTPGLSERPDRNRKDGDSVFIRSV